ncbi:MAG: hypothetical protein K0R50_1216 [Eubacterium sp.]|nr:hypothetical protein [Eubacterium sp.]
MNEKITALYTNLYDAKSAIGTLRTNGISKACLNTSECGLHFGINPRQRLNKFPGAVPSTMVKLEIDVDQSNRTNALTVLEGSFGVIE